MMQQDIAAEQESGAGLAWTDRRPQPDDARPRRRPGRAPDAAPRRLALHPGDKAALRRLSPGFVARDACTHDRRSGPVR